MIVERTGRSDARDEGQGGAVRILAVDDDPIALGLVETTLRLAGYGDVTCARSPAEALALIAGPDRFDLFLLDIQMPGISGIELCRRIRSIEAHRDSPILMVSSLADRGSIDRAFAAGATDYVNKPFDATELVVRIGLAEQLCRQQAELRQSRHETDFLRSRSGLGARIGLDDAFGISGIPTALSPVEMENHLLRMPRLRAWRSRSYTVRIEAVERLHQRLPAEDFYDLVADVADAVAAAFKPWPHVLSYVGGGAFAVVVEGSARPKPEHLRFEIHAQIHALGLQARDGSGVTVEVEPSMPVGILLDQLSQRPGAPVH